MTRFRQIFDSAGYLLHFVPYEDLPPMQVFSLFFTFAVDASACVVHLHSMSKKINIVEATKARLAFIFCLPEVGTLKTDARNLARDAAKLQKQIEEFNARVELVERQPLGDWSKREIAQAKRDAVGGLESFVRWDY